VGGSLGREERPEESASKHVRYWLESLPSAERLVFIPWALSGVHPSRVWGLTNGHKVRQAQRELRKAETDAVVPQFAAIRAEAHFRHNRLVRLRQAYYAAVERLQAQGGPFPYAFSYEEGADSVRGLPPQERLHFQTWDRRSFVLAHAGHYHPQTLKSVHAQRGAFTAGRNGYFLEFLRAERLSDSSPPEGLWFAEILQMGALGRGATNGERFLDTQRWLRAWGYGEENAATVRPFDSRMAGLLSWPKADSHFMSEAQERTAGVLIL